MSDLFNQKTIEHICKDMVLTDTQKESAKKWLNLLDDDKLSDEKSNYLKFAHTVLDSILGYPIEDIDFEVNNVEFQFNNSNGEKVLCVEAKGTSTKDLFSSQHRDKKEHGTPIKQTWDYIGSNGLKYGICTNYERFILITKEFGYSKYYEFDFKSCEREEKLREFVGIFSKQRLVDGGTAERIIEKSITETREFTDEFYKLFHETRLAMIKSFQDNGVEKHHAIYYTQLLLNRLMFVFFIEGTGLIPDSRFFNKRMLNLLQSVNPTEHSKKVYDDIQEIFEIFDKGSDKLKIFGFNGGLFSGILPQNVYFSDLKDDEYFNDVKQNSELSAADLDHDISIAIQRHENLSLIVRNLLLMNSFDFQTQVNVDILGHIFEQSISDLEDLRESNTSKRKQEGIYYTSESITDYICRNTIIPYLSLSNDATDPHDLVNEYIHADKLDELEEKFRRIKILDPACGSGAFLVKAADTLLEIHRIISDYKESSGRYYGLEKWNEESEIRSIIQNNIYGVDISKESVEIARLSMFFKLASQTKRLPDLTSNIKAGNSLISDRTKASNAFDWHAEFPEIFPAVNAVGGFDVHIGNPPYIRQESLLGKEDMQLSNVSSSDFEKFTIPSKTDLSGYFQYHFLARLKPGGLQGFITSDSWMSYDYGKELQKFLSENGKIRVLMRTKFNAFHDADVKTITTIMQNTSGDGNITSLLYVNTDGDLFTPNTKCRKTPQDELGVGNWNLHFTDSIPETKVAMMRMKDAGILKRGKTTGRNDFFVLNRKIIEEFGIDKKYAAPVISRDIHEGILEDSDASEYLLYVPDSKGRLVKTEEGRRVLSYIEKGENTRIIPKKGKDRTECTIPELKSVRTNNPWYRLELGEIPSIFLGRFADKKLKFYENNGRFYARDNFAYFTPRNKSHTQAFLAYLSSSWFSLYAEKHGHPAGGGALQFLINNYEDSNVPDFDNMEDKEIEKMKNAWVSYCDNLSQEDLDNVVFQVLGFNNSEQDLIIKELDVIRDQRLSSKQT